MDKQELKQKLEEYIKDILWSYGDAKISIIANGEVYLDKFNLRNYDIDVQINITL